MTDSTEQLIDLLGAKLESYRLDEIEYEDEAQHLVLKRHLVSEGGPKSAAVPAAPVTSTATAPGATPPTLSDPDLIQVRAPLLGIAYRSKDPDSPAFAQVGDQVKAGDTLCLVEAMKVFNEICAPADGTVQSIDFQNGQMVEYDQVLITLK
ncbi:MAG: hypothetical protein LBL67_03050 [Coriobacteriales bacterium]|jgi:acetyl-CoA carboxylase biotin carboxyl carrier protein|nr:hypothetical protein [Coriobacteriales bacterium]